MKRRLLLALLLLGFCGVTYGQIKIRHSRDVLVSKRVSVGVKLGVNDCKMYYTDSNVKLQHNYSMRPAFGLYVEIPVARYLSVSPEFMYIQRGTKTNYVYEGNYKVNYDLNVRYFDFRVPIQYYWLVTRVVKPYIYAAPDFGYVLGGKITLKQPGLDIPEATCNVGSANMSAMDFSILGGLGCRFDITMSRTSLYIKVEAGYNYGLMNTFSSQEKTDGPESLNVHAYNVTGSRFNRGIEFMLSVGMPFYSKKGTCSYFERQPSDRW